MPEPSAILQAKAAILAEARRDEATPLPDLDDPLGAAAVPLLHRVIRSKFVEHVLATLVTGLAGEDQVHLDLPLERELRDLGPEQGDGGGGA